MTLFFKQVQEGKVKDQEQRDKMLSLFLGRPPANLCSDVSHMGPIALVLLTVKEPGK
jgi:hypothetical protein